MPAHNLKELEHQERVKGQPLITRADTNFAIRTDMSHAVDFNACYWNFMTERVGNNTNRMSAPGKFLRHFLDRRRSADGLPETGRRQPSRWKNS